MRVARAETESRLYNFRLGEPGSPEREYILVPCYAHTNTQTMPKPYPKIDNQSLPSFQYYEPVLDPKI